MFEVLSHVMPVIVTSPVINNPLRVRNASRHSPVGDGYFLEAFLSEGPVIP